MANTFLTPSVIAREALATLYNNVVVAGLLHRDFDADFNGQVGDTVNVRKPAVFAANEFDYATGIVIQDATEGSVPVKLDKTLDVSFAVTHKQLSLEIKDFKAQLLDPAMEAIAQKLDQLAIAQLLASTTMTVGTNGTTPTEPRILLDAGKLLNDNNVPRETRSAVLTTAAEAEFLKTAIFSEADKRGDTEGLREASIGRKFGFDTYGSTNLTGGDSFAFHRTAVAVATRVPALDPGLAPEKAAVVNYKGLGLRVVSDYDITKKRTIVSVDMLAGTSDLDAAHRSVKIFG